MLLEDQCVSYNRLFFPLSLVYSQKMTVLLLPEFENNIKYFSSNYFFRVFKIL